MIHEKLHEHRAVWARKPALCRIYRRYFAEVLRRTAPLEPIVELGSGPGFFKEYRPELIATDIEETPWTDRVADCCALPFEDRSVGNLVMVDVFHHLAEPRRFLDEAARVLEPGGRVVLLEPWTSPAGYRFYRHLHHEDADRSVDPERPFAEGKDPFDGNAALPELYFTARRGAAPLGHQPGRLHVLAVEHFAAASWLLSCGFRSYQALPDWLLRLVDATDRVRGPFARLLALRALITLERPVTAGSEGRAARPGALRPRRHEAESHPVPGVVGAGASCVGSRPEPQTTRSNP